MDEAGGLFRVMDIRDAVGAMADGEITRAPDSWAARSASSRSAGGSPSTSANAGTITVSARASRSSPQSGSSRNRPTRTACVPHTLTSYQGPRRPAGAEPRTS
jgi:hypothetical protein